MDVEETLRKRGTINPDENVFAHLIRCREEMKPASIASRRDIKRMIDEGAPVVPSSRYQRGG